MRELYKSYDSAVSFYYSLAERHPELVSVTVIGRTWEERDIVLVTLSSPVEKADDKPAVLYTGTIHAREWIGHELAFDFVRYVINDIDIDPWLQGLFERGTIYIVPCANPDGFEYSRTHFSFWRKNRRKNPDGSYGVDLNRNFSAGFFNSKIPTFYNTYPGPEPFSEPETKALKQFVESHPNITIALDYHSQGNVFFPAHDFKHEDTIDTTDMNALCANMAEEVRKVSNREYGIHQGKPPANLVSGAGREYYYAKGIISTVVEVGTRNISDYLDDMYEHLKEHIPALLSAVSEAPNYAKDNPLKRVEHFQVESVSADTVALSWEYNIDRRKYPKVHFEIYRSTREKSFCNKANLVGMTTACSFIDTCLENGKEYYYHIRAASKKHHLKSPYAPVLHVRTLLADTDFGRTYYPLPDESGYIAEKSPDNRKHFGHNSLFVGVSEQRGMSYAIIKFPLTTIPENATIKSASLSLYPINRVSTTIEKYGEWLAAIAEPESMQDIANFDDVHNCKVRTYVGRPIKSNQLSQGIWRNWEFSQQECHILQQSISENAVCLRIEGPKELKIGRTSQMMQWDIGYGKFGAGLNFRPKLNIIYSIEPNQINIYPKHNYVYSKHSIDDSRLVSGFDAEGNEVVSLLEFGLSTLPNYNFTYITKAYVMLNSIKTYIKEDIRFHLELIAAKPGSDYDSLKDRVVIEKIGYDVSINELKNKNEKLFIFDTFSLMRLNEHLRDNHKVYLLIKPTTAKKQVKNKLIEWYNRSTDLSPKLIVEYINKRRFAVEKPTQFRWSIDKGKIRLDWNNPSDRAFWGVKVIRNPFRPPRSPYDGIKIYAGSDNYTYDTFGSLDIDKYFAIFTYDEVPNFSEPVVIHYKG